MTHLGWMIWFVASAVMTLSVLTIGTLAAADLLPHRRRATADTDATTDATRPEAARAGTVENAGHAPEQEHGDAA